MRSNGATPVTSPIRSTAIDPTCSACAGQGRERRGEHAGRARGTQDGPAQSYIPVAGGVDRLLGSWRVAACEQGDEEPVVDQLRHSLASSGSPNPTRAASQCASAKRGLDGGEDASPWQRGQRPSQYELHVACAVSQARLAGADIEAGIVALRLV